MSDEPKTDEAAAAPSAAGAKEPFLPPEMPPAPSPATSPSSRLQPLVLLVLTFATLALAIYFARTM